ncbi:hypothetical protein LXA43DRAFT_495366 [Ganoderma leucocontextum]|nr:hypothetical protein LXA43DRAFT_495366 [Ganoderma leucocontextum]
MDDSTSAQLFERRVGRGDAWQMPAKTFSVAEIMLPDHLLLRVAEGARRVLVNWPAYKFGIETILRANGLEGHIAASGHLRLPRQVSQEQWAAEEELCRAIIGFNVKDFTQIFGSSRLSEKEVGEIWKWLSGLDKERMWHGMELEPGECKYQ